MLGGSAAVIFWISFATLNNFSITYQLIFSKVKRPFDTDDSCDSLMFKKNLLISFLLWTALLIDDYLI